MTLANSVFAKLSVAFVALATAFVLAAPAQAQMSESEMQEEIDRLTALIEQLTSQIGGGSSVSSSVCPYTWTRSLSMGDTGMDVMKLQQFLNSDPETRVAASGVGSAGMETQYYGGLTGAAVAKFQTKYRAQVLTPLGLVNATTFFGPSTMAHANSLCTSSSDDGMGGDDDDDSSSDELEGGAGSIDSADFISSLNNEEVGEDEEDASVAGLEIEADGSDIEITAVTLDFDYADSGADTDLDDYAEEVSIWFEGEEVARVDADEFEDDDDFEKTISLDRGAIVREGETAELVVAVSGLSNLDSSNQGEDWNVQFTSVRFRDAQNAVISETTVGDIDSTTDNNTTTASYEREFSFESFASAADVEVKISSGDDEINDARAIEVDDNDDTNDVEWFSFEVEVEGDSDITIDDIVATSTITGTATQLNDIFSDLVLMMDGEEVGSENAPADTVVTFDDLDLELEAGETYEFVVVVDIIDTNTGTYAEGDTVTMNIGTTQRNAWDAEDETGEDLENGDFSGTATTEAHTVYLDGIMVTEIESTSASANDGETVGTFRIKFAVTAFGDDQYIHELAANSASSTDAGFYYTVYKGGTATTTNTNVSSVVTTTADDDGEYYVIEEGETETFTLTVTVDPDAGGAGLYSVELGGDTNTNGGLRFDPDNAADSASTDDTWYTVPSSLDKETDAENLVAS